LNNYTPLYYGSLRRIMSATLGGFVHAKDIENLRKLVTDYLSKHCYKVSWDYESPYREGDSYFWHHVFKSGSIKHIVVFKENSSGKLGIYIDGQVVANVGSKEGFSGKILFQIASRLKA